LRPACRNEAVVPPQPSARLVRAAAAERAELERRRTRLAAEAEELHAALARVERAVEEIDERCALLERVAPAPSAELAEHQPSEPDAAALRGPAIREAAVLTAVEHGREALHYREWFELLAQRHEIAGKDPLAVFLTQLSRSPAVRRGTRTGVYELDRHAAQRLRETIDGLQRELRELPATGSADLAVIRGRRTQLTAEIGRAERALEEVARVLGPRPAFVAAAG
jgi:hypothetical protein